MGPKGKEKEQANMEQQEIKQEGICGNNCVICLKINAFTESRIFSSE